MDGSHHIRRLTRHEKIFLLLFLLSLPLANPWVRGDGVGYYAYARALVVNGSLRFEADWLRANPSFSFGRVNGQGQIRPEQYTATGHLDNHFAIGAALDWMPFLLFTHDAVRVFDHFGGRIPADGFSWPYVFTMAMVTALAGFFGLLLSYSLACRYFPERWAFLATLGIWLASSLPVYMYFNPSWSHAHSAFAVALFLWYWDRTRDARTFRQWALLGLISALMIDVYYLNAIFLLLPLVESIWLARDFWRSRNAQRHHEFLNLLAKTMLYASAVVIGLLPTLATRWIIYGNPFTSGYIPLSAWNWASPVFMKVLFSSDHGLFSWTPILILASLGLVFVSLRERKLGVLLSVCTIIFYILVASYPNWDGISSFGNRFFVSLTPVFVLGLTAMFAASEKLWQKSGRAWLLASAITGLLAVWNAGLIFQWGMHLIPDRGTFSWKEMAYNQFYVVPGKMSGSLERYFTRRSEMMQSIEKKDMRQLQDRDAAQDKGGS